MWGMTFLLDRMLVIFYSKALGYPCEKHLKMYSAYPLTLTIQTTFVSPLALSSSTSLSLRAGSCSSRFSMTVSSFIILYILIFEIIFNNYHTGLAIYSRKLEVQGRYYNQMLKFSIKNTINRLLGNMKKICTHDGRFHCDQVLACVLLSKYTQQFKDAEVIRSRDPAVWAQADVVVDVGGKYDPPKLLDHHQIQFQQTYPNYTVRMSSAGLVYLNFPQIIPNAIEQILSREKLPFEPVKSKEVIDHVRQSIYKHFVIYIDANDNGVSKVNEKDVNVPTTLWWRVGQYNPMWWQETYNELEQFHKAMEEVEKVFYAEVRQTFLGSLQTKQMVKEIFQQRKQVHPSGRIVVLKKYIPWQKPIFELQEEQKCQGQILYVLFPEKTGDKWRVQAVAKQEGSFELRKPLKEAWRGIKDDQKLRQLSGIEDITFVHANGFIGGAVSLESTLKMAVMSMEQK